MELVRGTKITDYCDENHLTTRERLALFLHVCHAIQHAHQKGILHRHIQPSTILVTLADDTPVPKVIDFVIAITAEETPWSLFEPLLNRSLDDGFRIAAKLPEFSLIHFDVPPRTGRIGARGVRVALVLELEVKAKPVHLLE